ncbi:hybrid sensor histidine kinase/response regulator transcription factor [Mariniflexile sp. AS56]|uniref:hybrid sensor histidine kinase/response regulator transcription factor n=1 Tax=Mariniflexile sp. AS56 TaxID=3063957 RepID=UPI0026EFACB6|nr:hybrid sensor histidine kinase/response regulator transcription factor [Mariniflexile sp. AS56]MDO7172435.1 two-component regulator propeller domain-containing protein [Mariniflexile sp. AS56]
MIKKLKHFKLILSAFLICLSLSCSFLEAQNFERFSNKEGFNQNTINTISQDRYGFLWFGTPNGLIKYDGYEFETYTTQTKTNGAISSNHITSLFNDSNGVLWIGTNIGINVYVPWLEKFYTIPLTSKLAISHICAGPNGTIWFSGENKLYACTITDVTNGRFQVSDDFLDSYTNISDINQFSFTNNNSIILGTSRSLNEVYFNKGTIGINSIIERIVNFENFDDNNVTSIKTIKNILWIGTYDGLFKTSFENSRIHIIRKYNTTNTDTKLPLKINTIFEDNNGAIWIGTRESGLLKYLEAEDKFKSYTYNPKDNLGLSSNLINSIFQDNYDVLWIGTAQGGINKLDITQKQFITYSKNPYDKQSITDNLTTSILEDNTGKLWISTYNKDLFRSTKAINDKSVLNIKFDNLSNQLDAIGSKNIIRCIYEDNKGFIWIGTDLNVMVYNPTTQRFKNVILKNNGKIVPKQLYRSIYQIDDTSLLFLGNQITIIKNPWTEIQSKNNPEIEAKTILDLDSRIVYQSVLKDKNKKLWFGTSNGLFYGHFDGEKIKIENHISDEGTSKLKLSYSSVFSLHEDHEGNIWVGTFGGGLNKISLDTKGLPSKIECFRKNDILPDDAIYGILQENDTNLWISTDMGLVKFNTNTHNVDVFDVRDGLAQNNFRQASYFKGKSGYFYFGGLNGLTVFKPKNIQLNSTPPKILITSLLVNNKVIKIGEKLDNSVILEKSISETERISISQNEQTIAFQLVVEHTSTPSKNKLAYKLEGFNETWIEEQVGKKTVTYTNLSAGNYVFKVKAANADGVWSPEIRSLKVVILPPWYQTWWSYLLFFIVTVLICVGIIVYFVQHEKLKQRLKYEQLDKERLDTINQGKFRYFTNISHEFRTPLTLIAGPLEHIISVNKDAGNTKYLAIIEKNTKRLLSLVDQLITFRKAEQGYIDLNFNQNTLGGFIYPTTEAFENYATEKNINFFYKVNSPNEDIVIDTEKVERILFNLLSNAFKNTPANGSISIESDIVYVSETKMIRIDVIDNGKGIPAKDLDNIFERFYQLGNKDENVSGGGIGLAFCKSLINLLEGEISVKSEPFVETRFSVLIPTGNIEDYEDIEVNSNIKSFIKDWVPLSTEYKNETLNETTSDELKEHHLLIVEDEEDVQNFLISTLSEKYNITIASNGIEGLEKIKLQEPTLVISDVMMPEMDGFAFCEKIKSAPETCHIPVLLLTALGTNEDTIKGLEFGADEYVSKPFSIKLLELRIKKLIDNNIKIKEYFTKNSTIPKKDIELSTRDEAFLNDIIQIMEENISNSNFGVEELSAKMNLSASHFYRRLKQLTGQIPNAYLRNFRLQRAAELLSKNDGTNVTEVMYQIGIESNSYFSTSFKKLHGVSPSQFMNRS